jgi:hypothetical protein
MRTCIVLIWLIIGGCASSGQPVEPAQQGSDLLVFYEEPKVDYESLGSVEVTSRASNRMEVLEKARIRAAELGANGIIVHSIRNRGTVAGGADAFGTVIQRGTGARPNACYTWH